MHYFGPPLCDGVDDEFTCVQAQAATILPQATVHWPQQLLHHDLQELLTRFSVPGMRSRRGHLGFQTHVRQRAGANWL